MVYKQILKKAPKTEQVSIVVRRLQIESSPPILATTTLQTVTHFITTTYQSVHDSHTTHKPKTKPKIKIERRKNWQCSVGCNEHEFPTKNLRAIVLAPNLALVGNSFNWIPPTVPLGGNELDCKVTRHSLDAVFNRCQYHYRLKEKKKKEKKIKKNPRDSSDFFSIHTETKYETHTVSFFMQEKHKDSVESHAQSILNCLV